MSIRNKILAIDDEIKILKILQNILSEDYDVIVANNGEEGVALAQAERPDLILVDRIMPIMNGIATTQFVRNCMITKNIPIIMVTALNDSSDRATAFKAGVDDFVSKPFHPDELLARISSKLTRFKNLKEPVALSREFSLLNLRLSLDEATAYLSDRPVHLTPLEFNILRSLISAQGKVQSRQQLLTEIWGDSETNLRALDVHITSLRKKIRRFTGSIETVYGRGYVIRER